MLTEALWAYVVGSWCMSFYVFFSCGEGLGWFRTFRNYFLILGVFIGLIGVQFWSIPSISLQIAFTGWFFYAFLIISRYGHYRLWRRHIIPVSTPLIAIVGFDVARLAFLTGEKAD